MSVLNQCGEEQQECPLCMEPLEVDDLNFYPCTCGYQICRFCWHRIRTDENGLCPACRKAYSENPADFTPLSQEQVAKLKAEKRQRDLQRKAKLSESRKHLASVRVVQRNLVFVVGLPVRLADAEVLRRHEYFGKFGKIHKVVINQSTAYAGSQGPSASAYVTYLKSDDALRAIQSVNNITLDGRQIKSSLGTTKYCSHFMKNQPCPKPDCMYLHDFGDSEASFTKEQMHAGKHQEYEKRLHDALLARIHNTPTEKSADSKPNGNNTATTTTTIPTTNSSAAQKTTKDKESSNGTAQPTQTNGAGNKENWPQLNNNNNNSNTTQQQQQSILVTGVSTTNTTATTTISTVVTADSNKEGKECKEAILSSSSSSSTSSTSSNNNSRKDKEKTKKNGHNNNSSSKSKQDKKTVTSKHIMVEEPKNELSQSDRSQSPPDSPPQIVQSAKLPPMDDNTSFFSANSFRKIASDCESEQRTLLDDEAHEQHLLTDALPSISTSEDWAAAFGFSRPEREEKSRFAAPQIHSHQDTNGYANKMDLAYNGFLLDVLSKTNGHQSMPSNGLEHNTSQFFKDFTKNNKDSVNFPMTNGGFYQTERVMSMQQKQLEDHYTNMRGPLYQQQPQQNGFGTGTTTTEPFGLFGSNSSGSKAHNTRHRSVEDELDFDPIQETQKAFAELMASEQLQQQHELQKHRPGGGGGMYMPPPPGFLQPQQSNQTHMNSFGSKILPFLNMSSTQQQQQQSQPQQNGGHWSDFSQVQHQLAQQQQQQHKNISNTCNDWKVLDPAILSSSRHYPLAANHFSNTMPAGVLSPQQQHQLQQQQLRQNYDMLGGSPFSFAQPTLGGMSGGYLPHHHHQAAPQTWFGGEINTTSISTPPGFRNQQANTKQQQEC